MAVDLARTTVQQHVRTRKYVAPPGDVEPLHEVRFALLLVNFSTTRYLKLLLATLSEQSAPELVRHLLLVDNGSRDGGPDFIERVRQHVPRVTTVERRFRLHHAVGMRAAVAALDDAERGLDDDLRSNVLMFCDTDVVFRSPDALRDLATCFTEHGAALAGEIRHAYEHSDIQASFFAVRRDVYDRPDIWPPVHDGAPAYRLQRGIWDAGLPVVDFPSNAGGHILHRGRTGVAAAATFHPFHPYATVTQNSPHFMGVADGARIWTEIERRHAALLEADGEDELMAGLAAAMRRTRPPGEQPALVPSEVDPAARLIWGREVLQRRSLGSVIAIGAVGEPHTMSGTGAVVWSLFETPTTTDEAVEALAAEFGVPADDVRAEVLGFVDGLAAAGLLQPEAPTSGR